MLDGWEYVTSDPDWDQAWRLAAEYKEFHERVRGDLFVRVRVVPRARVFWVLRRIEQRAERAAA